MYTMSKSCRICDSVLSRTHYVALFSRESLASDLANRLSKVADVTVASEDGLSRFICIPCKNKLMSGEYFRTIAKATYEKSKDPTLIASGSNSQVQVTNKRTKDSSGTGASPQTRQWVVSRGEGGYAMYAHTHTHTHTHTHRHTDTHRDIHTHTHTHTHTHSSYQKMKTYTGHKCNREGACLVGTASAARRGPLPPDTTPSSTRTFTRACPCCPA